MLAVVERSCARKPQRPSLQAEVREAESRAPSGPRESAARALGGGRGGGACSSSRKRQVGA